MAAGIDTVLPLASQEARDSVRHWASRTGIEMLETAEAGEKRYGIDQWLTERDRDAVTFLGASWGWSLVVRKLAQAKPLADPLAKPPLMALERRRRRMLEAESLPDPVDEAEETVAPGFHIRLAFMVGLAVGVDAALDVLFGDGQG